MNITVYDSGIFLCLSSFNKNNFELAVKRKGTNAIPSPVFLFKKFAQSKLLLKFPFLLKLGTATYRSTFQVLLLKTI